MHAPPLPRFQALAPQFAEALAAHRERSRQPAQ